MISLGLLFWLVMILSLIFGFWVYRGAGEAPFNWTGFGGSFVVWILLALLGWAVFGAPLGGGK